MSGFDELVRDVRADRDARCAMEENRVRRDLATTLEAAAGGEVNAGTVSGKAGVPVAQVRRALHREVGGLLPLRAIVRIADHLGYDITINLRKREEP